MIFVQKENRSTYSFETHPMNGTNQLNGTSITMIHKHYTKVKLKSQCYVEKGGGYEN